MKIKHFMGDAGRRKGMQEEMLVTK